MKISAVFILLALAAAPVHTADTVPPTCQDAGVVTCDGTGIVCEELCLTKGYNVTSEKIQCEGTKPEISCKCGMDADSPLACTDMATTSGSAAVTVTTLVAGAAFAMSLFQL